MNGSFTNMFLPIIFHVFTFPNCCILMKDPREHRQNATIWKSKNMKDDWKKHVSKTTVHWSEMLRLPYFNPIRFLVVDPMHNLFLGIAHWIVKRLWIDSGRITKVHLELMEKEQKESKFR